VFDSALSFDLEQEIYKNNHVNVNNVQSINSFNKMTKNQNDEFFQNVENPC